MHLLDCFGLCCCRLWVLLAFSHRRSFKSSARYLLSSRRCSFKSSARQRRALLEFPHRAALSRLHDATLSFFYCLRTRPTVKGIANAGIPRRALPCGGARQRQKWIDAHSQFPAKLPHSSCVHLPFERLVPRFAVRRKTAAYRAWALAYSAPLFERRGELIKLTQLASESLL